MKPVYFHHLAAVSGIGDHWDLIWNKLNNGSTTTGNYKRMDLSLPLAFDDGRSDGLVAEGDIIYGRASGLAIDCVTQLLENIPPDEDILFYGGATHNEADIILAYNRMKANVPAPPVDPALLLSNLAKETIPTVLRQKFGKICIHTWLNSSCVSGLHALVSGILNSDQGGCHLVMAVDGINDIEVAGFMKIGGVTKDICRPFSDQRDGILIGEGAAGVIISHEKSRDGIFIAGYGVGCDAADATRPNGSGLKKAISSALKNACIEMKQLGAIIAHGTGTQANDYTEATILSEFPGIGKVPMTSVKGLLGHTMGASGLFNVLVAIYALKYGIIPPAGKLPGVISGFPIHLVTGAPEPINIQKPVMVIASGFGGNNVVIILRRDEK